MKILFFILSLAFSIRLIAAPNDKIPATTKTLVFLKPDAYEKRLWGAILSEFEKRGIKIVGVQAFQLTREQAESFYAMHKGKKFFNDLIDYITRAPILAVVLEAENAVTVVRELLGATDPRQAGKNTIRGRYGASLEANIIHGSDSPQAATREISFFFPQLSLFE